MSFSSPCTALFRSIKKRTQGKLNRRGAILILLLFLLPALLMVIGTAVDVSYLQLSRAEMRLAVDAASRAAADELARTENVNSARSKAIEIAALNQVAGQPLTLMPSDVQFGASTVNSSGRWLFAPGQTPTNAVRIVGVRNSDRSGGGLPLFFGGLFGTTQLDSQFTSVASFRTVDISLVLDRSTSMKLDVNSNQQGMYTNDPRFCSAPYSTSRWTALSQAVSWISLKNSMTPKPTSKSVW
jgi:Ca-activated chloride channel homolog